MSQTIHIKINDLWKSKDIHVYAGEELQIVIVDGSPEAQYVIAIQGPSAAEPPVQVSSDGLIFLAADVLAGLPKNGGVEYALWERGEGSDILRRRGRFTVSSTIRTEGLPDLTEMPTISGDFAAGSTLSLALGVWPDAPALSHVWTKGGIAMTQATNPDYVLSTGDVGYVIGARITARKNANSFMVVDALNAGLVRGDIDDSEPEEPEPVIPAPAEVIQLSGLEGVTGTGLSRDLASEFPSGAMSFALAAGSLPVGLVLSEAGVISGTPISVAQQSCTISAELDGTSVSGVLVLTITEGPLQALGTAYLEAEGQSNIAGFNSVDDLAPQHHKNYPSISGFAIASGLGTTSTQVERQPYTLVPAGQAIDGVAGRSGEPNVGTSSGGVCPTFGMLKAVDNSALWSAATGTWLLKSSTAGQHIDQFLPEIAASVWKNKVYGRRQVRAEVAVLGALVFYQAKLWWQGEANTNAPRAAQDLTHEDITGYAGKFEQVYAFDEAQMGAQPPWFLIQLSANGGGVDDPYTAAINAELQGLCRWRVDLSGTITDTQSGHSNRYFVAHDLTNGCNPHLTAPQMDQIGAAISNALKELQGSDGFSAARPVLPLPVITSLSVDEVEGSSLTLSLTSTDIGTLFVAVVPTGSAAPTVAQIKSGTGQGIIAAHSQTYSGLHAPGGILTCTISDVPTGSDVDIHVVLTDGLDSVPASVLGLGMPSAAAFDGWDITHFPERLTYSDGNNQVNNTGGATRYAQGATTLSSGKRYFEIERIGAMHFAGIGRSGISIGGGANGTDKVGWLFANVQHTGGFSPMGAQPSTAAIYQIAVDVEAKLFWVRGDGIGSWNNDAAADPAAGTGGLDCSGLGTEIVPTAGIVATNANGARLKTSPTSWTHSAPAGFASIE